MHRRPQRAAHQRVTRAGRRAFQLQVVLEAAAEGGVDLVDGDVHCVVAEVACRYHASLAFPDRVAVGLRVAHIGRSSVRYEIGLFKKPEAPRPDITSVAKLIAAMKSASIVARPPSGSLPSRLRRG